MACAVTKRPLVYFTFGDMKLRDELAMIYEYLSQNKISIGKRLKKDPKIMPFHLKLLFLFSAELFTYLRLYAEQKSSMHLYEFIISCHQDPR